jgi:hypothetical protein
MGIDERVRLGLLVATGALVVAVLLLGVAVPVAGMEDGRAWALAFVGFPVAAVLLLWRRPGNVIGRLLGLVALAGAGIFALTWFAVVAADHPASAVAEALATGGVASVLICAVAAILLLFPTGRPLSGMKRTFAAFLAMAVTWTAVSTVRTGSLPVTGRESPLGSPAVAPVVAILEYVPLIFLVLAAWTLVLRHHRGGPRERAQLRWLFSSALLVLTAVTAAGLPPADAPPAVLLLFGVVLVVGFWSVPAAIVVAISRYRLYDIDRVWSRTASYAIVAGVLVLVYVGSIVGLQAVLPGGSDLAVAASTLAVAAIFSPLRRRVRSLVDRWFDRSRFEAERVISGFSADLRHEIDLDAIVAGLVEASRHTMRPSGAHLWLVDRASPRGEREPGAGARR